MPKHGKFREIEWGYSTCIYCLGHADPGEFLERLRAESGLDTPSDAIEALQLSDVMHIRFRPMSPSEAKSHGYDWGVMETKRDNCGYKVTAVTFDN